LSHSARRPTRSIGGQRWATLRLTGGSHKSGFSQFLLILDENRSRKIAKNREKNPEKIVDVGNPIWHIFHYCNIFQISTDFEIFKRFPVKAALTNLCSIRLIATNFPN
jgi:hypothetical protein